jgi:hypothetical protein
MTFMLASGLKKASIRQILKIDTVSPFIKMKILMIILIMAGISGCEKSSSPPAENQSCIDQKITEFTGQACDSTATINKYTFQGKTVYVFNPGFCEADAVSAVLNSDCEVLGFLGGITGNTEINGEDFSHAQFISTIWQN